jgi:hypothetical protein
MSAVEEIAEMFRAMRSDLDDARRRLASVVMIGKVVERDGDKVRLEFDEKDPSTGKPFRSPLLRRANSAGNGHKERNRAAMGEVMMMVSPGGEIGRHSRAVPYGPVDESPEPEGDDDFPRVIQEGNARIAIKDGMIRVTVEGKGFELTAAQLQMIGVFKAEGGSRPAHYVGGVDDGGDKAVDGNSNVLI